MINKETLDMIYDETEELIVRYRTINDRLMESIKNNTLYLNDPNKFNDPFDCVSMINEDDFTRVVLGKIFDEATRTGINPNTPDAILKFNKQIETMKSLVATSKEEIKQVGIACFCETTHNTLMWSHYADSHRGICLVYKKSEIEDFAKANNNFIFKKVDYIKSLKSHNHFDFISNKLDIKSLLHLKGDVWEYENEWRLISTTCSERNIKSPQLHAVIFGYKTTDDNIVKIYEILGDDFIYFKMLADLEILKLRPHRFMPIVVKNKLKPSS